MPLKELGKRLKELRKERRLSLAEVGKNAKISHNYLSEIESGKKEPSKETVRSLAEFYEIDEDEFFAYLDKVPLRTLEFVENDPYLQKLLSEVQRKYKKEPHKIEAVRGKIMRLYKEILDED
jgi:transcriptional regulator with XRE-family HTH domain